MAVRTNTAFENKSLDASFNGGAGIDFNNGTLEFRSGAQPANADAALSGTVLATIALPADAFGAASSRSVAKLGTWADSSADNAGTIGHAVLRDSTNTYRIDLSVTATGGGGDITVDNTVLAAGQAFTVTSFTLSRA